MTKPHSDYELVTSQSHFLRTVEELLAQAMVAVDTESNSLFAYRERVCMIQFSIPGKDYLVDPLALHDLSALHKLFADGKIEKIFHAAEYDLLTLKRDFGFKFKNIFDTMLAARILGRPRVGLGNLLESEFGILIEKKYQRANWGRRPLPKPMLDYARMDTRYLIRLRNMLAKELQGSPFWQVANEDFARLCHVNGTPPEPQEVDVWRISGVRDLKPQAVAVLYHLAEYRQDQAEMMDRPLFKVIGDKTLVAVAEAKPERLEDLSGLPGMTDGQIRRHGRAMLNAVQKGLQGKPIYRPRPPAQDECTLVLLDALREWRKHTAQKLGVESDVVLPRDLMEKIAYGQPADMDCLAGILAETPWRLAEFGGQIHSIIKRK